MWGTRPQSWTACWPTRVLRAGSRLSRLARRSSRFRPGEERGEAVGELARLPGELAGRSQHLLGGAAGVPGRLLEAGHVGGDLAGPLRGLRDRPRDVVRRCALLLDRGGDGGRDAVDVFDRARDLADDLDRLAGGRLDLPDLTRDLAGCTRRLGGERLHFLRDDRETLAGLPGARRFDRGV